MARGFIARHRKFKEKAVTHLAAVKVVDGMVDRVIEDKLIPDLLISILRKNEFLEDVGLYSAENQSLYQVRSKIMDKVLRDMIRETVSASINTMINQYMRKRALTGRPEDD